MRKAAAFAAAFLVTLAVALVPLGFTNLTRTEPQPAAEANQHSYAYNVLPGVQRIDTELYLFENESVIASNDDVEGGRHVGPSRITTKTLSRGTLYTVEVTTYHARTLGAFILRIAPASSNPDYLRENLQPTSGECGEPLGVITEAVARSGQWKESCKSKGEGRTDRYAMYYTFILKDDARVTIDLAGWPSASGSAADLEENKLSLTCGWHGVCAGDVSAGQPGIDMGADPGEPVFLALEATADSTLRLTTQSLYIINRGCKKVQTEIVDSGGEVKATLNYTHVVVPAESRMRRLADVSMPQAAGELVLMEIAEVAKPSYYYVPSIDKWLPLPASQLDEYTENTACEIYGSHLHQSGVHGQSGHLFRNVDPDWRGVDVSPANFNQCDKAPENEGFPLRKYEKVKDANGACVFVYKRDDNGNFILNDEDEKIRKTIDGRGCFWSDTWIFSIQSSATAPAASDWSKDGPAFPCPASKSLTVVQGSGGTASPSGTRQHRPGKEVTLTATPGSDYYTHWTERGGIDIKEDSVVVRMNQDRTIHANFVPRGTLENLLIFFGNSIGVQFKSRHAARFELYRSSESSSICSPGTSGCTLAATVTKVAVATDAERTASFGDHPSGKYWVRGQYCASGSASPPGVATDACGKWSRLFGPHDHTASTATPTPTYKLTVRANPTSCGNVSGEDDYAEGEKAAIGASVKANANCHFTGWTGTGIENASSSSTKVTMGAAPKTVTANFTRQCKLTVQVTPSGGGTTTPAAGSTHTYDPCPWNVNLSASPGTGYRFGSWSGVGIASTSSSSTSVSMRAGDNKTVTTSFVRTSCTLTVKVTPSGGGTTTPAAGSTHAYDPCKSSVNLSASPSTGYRFDKWSGSGIASTSSSSTTIAMSAGDDKTVTARFVRKPATSCKLTVKVTPSGGGTTTPAAGTHTYDPCPQSVNLSATPSSGYRFGSWSGAGIASTSSSSTTVAMSAGDDKTVTARFARTSCTLTVRVSPSGGGTTTPAAGTHTYDPCKSSVNLSASPNTDYRFVRWDGSGIASTLSSSTTIAMKAGDDKTVTARFALTSCTLTVRVSPSGGGTTTPAAGTHAYSPCPQSKNLTATANSGYRFVRWYGASGTSASTSVALKDGDSKIVTARFAKQCTLTARSSPGGTVSGGGTFDCYTWKLLRATVTTGNSFARWTGDLSGSANPKWIYLNTDKNVRAVFRCLVTVTAGAGGSVTGNGSPDCGARWTVRAVHNDYHYLKRWIGDSRTSSVLTLYPSGNTTLRAVFDHVCNHPVYGAFCPVAGAAEESDAEP